MASMAYRTRDTGDEGGSEGYRRRGSGDRGLREVGAGRRGSQAAGGHQNPAATTATATAAAAILFRAQEAPVRHWALAAGGEALPQMPEFVLWLLSSTASSLCVHSAFAQVGLG